METCILPKYHLYQTLINPFESPLNMLIDADHLISLGIAFTLSSQFPKSISRQIQSSHYTLPIYVYNTYGTQKYSITLPILIVRKHAIMSSSCQLSSIRLNPLRSLYIYSWLKSQIQFVDRINGDNNSRGDWLLHVLRHNIRMNIQQTAVPQKGSHSAPFPEVTEKVHKYIYIYCDRARAFAPHLFRMCLWKWLL